ncbi:hypothetical protein [Desulfovibrio inopinatus]|uniref:hypothetical protein n=1 Tax=Desulfovibrio inopinatus TaxID=102109 RepID=UPI000408FFF0|nr:hypothetical protein [Desulfovibrio inopinatus]
MSIQLDFQSLGNDGLAEIVNRELERVFANIQDPNTDHKKKREVQIKVSFSPNKERNFIGISYATVTKLAPVAPVEISGMADGNTIYIPEIGFRPNQHELPLNVSELKQQKG